MKTIKLFVLLIMVQTIQGSSHPFSRNLASEIAAIQERVLKEVSNQKKLEKLQRARRKAFANGDFNAVRYINRKLEILKQEAQKRIEESQAITALSA